MPSFGALSEDCLVLILSKISPGDLCRLSAVSTAFRSGCESNALWEPFLSSLPHSQSTFVSSRDFYFCYNKKRRFFHVSTSYPILLDKKIQCENEHVACHWCYNSSSGKCSACIPSTAYKRCQLLKKIIKSLERSCNYLNYGCGQTFSRIMEVDCHEIGCEFAPYSCPIEGCNFSAPSTRLSKHLSDRHGDSVTRFRYNQLNSTTLTYDERFCILQETNDGNVFLVHVTVL